MLHSHSSADRSNARQAYTCSRVKLGPMHSYLWCQDVCSVILITVWLVVIRWCVYACFKGDMDVCTDVMWVAPKQYLLRPTCHVVPRHFLESPNTQRAQESVQVTEGDPRGELIRILCHCDHCKLSADEHDAVCTMHHKLAKCRPCIFTYTAECMPSACFTHTSSQSHAKQTCTPAPVLTNMHDWQCLNHNDSRIWG